MLFSSVYLLDSAEQHFLHFQVLFNNLPGNTFSVHLKNGKDFEITCKRQTTNLPHCQLCLTPCDY